MNVHLLSELRPRDRVLITRDPETALSFTFEATFRRLAQNPQRAIFETDGQEFSIYSCELGAWYLIQRAV